MTMLIRNTTWIYKTAIESFTRMTWKPGDKLPKPNSRKTIAAKNVRERKRSDADAGITRITRSRRLKCIVCGRMMKAYSDEQGEICRPCSTWMKKRRDENDGRL